MMRKDIIAAIIKAKALSTTFHC